MKVKAGLQENVFDLLMLIADQCAHRTVHQAAAEKSDPVPVELVVKRGISSMLTSARVFCWLCWPGPAAAAGIAWRGLDDAFRSLGCLPGLPSPRTGRAHFKVAPHLVQLGMRLAYYGTSRQRWRGQFDSISFDWFEPRDMRLPAAPVVPGRLLIQRRPPIPASDHPPRRPCAVSLIPRRSAQA